MCEGEKTEPNYFTDLRRDKQLTAVEVCGEECGPDPKTVVDYAVRAHEAAERDGIAYDAVWCVFDRNRHARIHEAFDRARAHGFNVAFSNPCFELWLLLHFEDSSAHRSTAQVMSRLKKVLPEYDKARLVYASLVSLQQKAMLTAAKLRKHHESTGTKPPKGAALHVEWNPFTSVDQLVVALNGLAAGQRPKSPPSTARARTRRQRRS